MARHIGTLKSFEIHGGSPADYKETLASLRDAVVIGISKEEDSRVLRGRRKGHSGKDCIVKIRFYFNSLL